MTQRRQLGWIFIVLTALGCGQPRDPKNAPLSEARTQLLELAYRAASKFPVDPHIKNKSNAQAAVVEASLELDQPVLAKKFLEGLAGWRRGAAYTKLARWCLEHEAAGEIDEYLRLARESADTAARDGAKQAWRRDRVLAGIAEVSAMRARNATLDLASKFRTDLKVVDAIFEIGDFDRGREALETCVELHAQFYDDAAKRADLSERVLHAFPKLPIDLRIDHILALAKTAADHGDDAECLILVDSAQDYLRRGTWLPENEIPLRARLARARLAGGDVENARKDAADCLALFDAKRATIHEIYQASCLRPVAELYHVLGDRERALEIYSRCIEAGVQNPNSRPRADDFVATCCSLALHGVEIDAAMSARLSAICAGLGSPW